MKKFFAVILAAAVNCSVAFAADPNENLILKEVTVQPTSQPAQAMKNLSVEKVAEARTRVLDKTHVISDTSPSVCLYSSLDAKLDAWLVERPEIVVDRKEFLTPAYKPRVGTSGKITSLDCTTTLVVHYRKK